MRSEQVFNQLPAGTRSGNVAAYLRSETGEILYSFLYGPEALPYKRAIKYAKAEVAQTNVTPFQYLGTDGRSLRLENLLLEGGNSKSVRPLIEDLEKLAEADPANGRYAPAIVYFSWGSQIFGPAILVDEISWEETSWLSGEPQEARLSITLQRIPPNQTPNATATIEPILPEQTQSTNTLYQAAQRGLNQATSSTIQSIQETSLTDRQRADGTRKAETWVRANLSAIPAEARRFYSSNKYSLATDSKGAVTFANAKNTYTLPVGEYTGSTFIPSIT